MRKIACFLFYLSLQFFVSASVFAAHIVGGEMSYKCLGNNNYLITLKLYRDCNSTGSAYDNPTTITIFDKSGSVVQTIGIDFPGSSRIPNNTNNLCLTAPPNICVEEAVFSQQVNLPPILGGYTLVFQRCCRNTTILNIYDPGATGASYVAIIPDPLIAKCNSSPVFTKFPPTVICVNEPLVFDHSAKDPDGDSLAYSFFNPYAGGSTTVVYPVPANPPPYPLVNFSGYTYTNPVGGSVPLSIDEKTGLLTGTPNTIGQFVVGIAVREYRKGVLLSTHYRDFQFNVVQCIEATKAAFSPGLPACKDNAVKFTNTSVGGNYYHWDFGVPGSDKDTSNQFSPSYTYKSAGTYTVKLLMNKGMSCESSDSMKITVSAVPDSKPSSNSPVCSGDSVKLKAEAVAGAAYLWLGPGGFTSTQRNPFILPAVTQNSGDYSLVVTLNGCSSAVATTSVTVNPTPVVTAGSNSPVCDGQSIQLTASSIAGASYSWRNSKGFTSTLQNPVINNITFSDADIYTVTTVARGCSGGPASTEVKVLPSPASPKVNNNTPICSGSPLTLSAEGVTGGTFQWTGPNNFSSTEQNPVITNTQFADSGTYSATVTVAGCPSRPSLTNAIINFAPTATFTVTPPVICEGERVTVTYTGNGKSGNDFLWNYEDGTGTTTGMGHHSIHFEKHGVKTITLTTAAEKCPPTTFSQVLLVDSLPLVDFTVNDLGCAPFPASFQNKTQNGKSYHWRFGDGDISQEVNPLHNYSPGTFSVQLIATNENGCKDSIFKPGLIHVIPNPAASFSSNPPLSRVYEVSEAAYQFTNDSKYATHYSWYFGDSDSSQIYSPVHSFKDTGNFTVTLIARNDIGCTDTTHSELIQIVPDINYYIPNAFTPNNDGVNDIFRVYGRSLNKVSLIVFNRLGEIVFKSENMSEGWDGRYRGQLSNTGVYIYYAVMETLTGKSFTKKGDVTLIR